MISNRKNCIEKSEEFDFVRDTCREFVESLPEKPMSHKNSPKVNSIRLPSPDQDLDLDED